MSQPAPTSAPRVVLGIETSCDETAAALVDGERRVLAEALYSQEQRHAPFGGVVPEIAARAHVEILDRLIARVMAEAGLRFEDLAGVAATAGPGLIGGLIVGLVTAKAISAVNRLPLLAINNLEGHALTARGSSAGSFSTVWRTAVFRPEKEKSQPGLRHIGRGSAKRRGSPPTAARSTAGPPGKPSPSSLAVLSKHSPAASSMVVPSRVKSPGPRTVRSWQWPPDTSSSR